MKSWPETWMPPCSGCWEGARDEVPTACAHQAVPVDDQPVARAGLQVLPVVLPIRLHSHRPARCDQGNGTYRLAHPPVQSVVARRCGPCTATQASAVARIAA